MAVRIHISDCHLPRSKNPDCNQPIPIQTQKEKPMTCPICTDSQYVKNGMESWIHGWKKNGWKTAAKKPVKNDDLWKELDSLVQQHEVRWTWVKGHAGHPENEKADELANQGAAKFL